jgi:hypothetical protein
MNDDGAVRAQCVFHKAITLYGSKNYFPPGTKIWFPTFFPTDDAWKIYYAFNQFRTCFNQTKKGIGNFNFNGGPSLPNFRGARGVR